MPSRAGQTTGAGRQRPRSPWPKPQLASDSQTIGQYRDRRSADRIKVKHVRTQEVVVGGWTPGEGRRHGAIGSLLLGIPVAGAGKAGGLEFVGLVGTGFSERTRDGMLRTPSWRGLRPDKAPGDVKVE